LFTEAVFNPSVYLSGLKELVAGVSTAIAPLLVNCIRLLSMCYLM